MKQKMKNRPIVMNVVHALMQATASAAPVEAG
jgi:hypothetical protein